MPGKKFPGFFVGACPSAAAPPADRAQACPERSEGRGNARSDGSGLFFLGIVVEPFGSAHSAQRPASSPLLTVQAAHRILCALGSRVPMLQGQAHPHTAGAGLVRALAARPHIGDAIRVFGTMTLNQQEMARFA